MTLARAGVLPMLRSFALPVAMLMLVVLMVVPIPAFLLDIFFVINIMISLAVLMVALNAQKPLDFSTFPTVLLFATLLRLGLNVASTRVVLVHGHEGEAAAGHVIEAFGTFLIGGDYVVGIFVFAILMIINMIVITKGAGRVSEVSARFTLDALPGKQMAIDADLNAGLMTPEEAKARRVEVSTEADFYGSMDGASKFVKGDAVAGLLILAVNIVGGLILGIVSHGLTIGDAAPNYTMLAIGDALVAQVPALLLSIAAASIVTRVNSPRSAGPDRRPVRHRQDLDAGRRDPRLLGLLPGMPHLIILPAAAVAGYRRVAAAQVGAMRRSSSTSRSPSRSIRRHRLGRRVRRRDVVLDIGYGLVPLVDERRDAPLMGRITGVREQISKELGFVMPQVRVHDDINLAPYTYRIIIGGVVVGEDQVQPDEMLALDTGQAASRMPGKAAKDPTFGLDAVWIATGDADAATGAGYLVVDPGTVIATHLNQMLRQNAADLLGPDEVQTLLDGLKERAAQLVAALSPQPLSLTDADAGAARAAERGHSAEGIPPHRRRHRDRRPADAGPGGAGRADPPRSGRAHHPETVRRARAAARHDAGGTAGGPARPGGPVRHEPPPQHRTRTGPPHRRCDAARRPAADRRGASPSRSSSSPQSASRCESSSRPSCPTPPSCPSSRFPKRNRSRSSQ